MLGTRTLAFIAETLPHLTAIMLIVAIRNAINAPRR
jgi:hypothetical protein